MTPFPAIQGCSATTDHGNCILTVDSTEEITCNANRYYPDIDLYFQLGSENVAIPVTHIWNNTDGTRNKSVTIVGHISNEVYICVATEIPGVNGNRSTSVRLIGQNASLNPAAFIVPIVLTLFITTGMLTMTVFYRRRKTPNVKDLVSYVELWKLVELAFMYKETDQLDKVVTALCNNERESLGVVKDAHYYYTHLCTWKETTTKKRQRKVLKEKLHSKNAEKTLWGLRDYRKMKSAVIEWFDLKHVLNEIGEREKITKFLESLGIDHSNIRGTAETSPKTFIQQAVGLLQAWNTDFHSINPVIILSSILEKLNHDSANKFFIVPRDKKQVLEDSERTKYSRDFSKKHVDMLSTIIKNVRGDNKPLHNMKVLRDNPEVLFNTEIMLRDWWNKQQYSYYRRRCILDGAVTVHSVQTNATEDIKLKISEACLVTDQWPSNDELKLIADHIDNKYTKHIRERLELTNLSQNSNRNDVFDALCAWRQSMKEDFPTMYRMLLSALKDTNVSGLLSPLKMDDIQRAEYVEIAFNLLMTDILPVVSHLGINETKLSSYRPAFEPSHLQEGTIGLVSTLITFLDKNKQREDLCRKLKEGGFPSSIQLNIIAHQMSYGELSAMFTSPTRCKTSADEKTEATQHEPQEGDSLLAQEEIQAPDTTTTPVKPKVTKAAESTKGFSRIKNILRSNSSKQSPDTTQQEKKSKEGGTSLGESTTKTSLDTAIAMESFVVKVAEALPVAKERATTLNDTTFPIEPCVGTFEASRHLSEIMKTLNLSVEDVSSSVDNNPDEFTLFKMWKDKTRFSAVSERASVIKCLQDSGKCELARSVIEGKFVPEEVNLSFVKHIAKKAKANNQLKEIAEAFGIEKGFEESQGSDDAISETIWNRLRSTKMWKVVKDGKSQMVQSQALIVNQADELVEYGFLDFARELLIIYQHKKKINAK
ncbi:uncharacterized protein LOC135154888 [Lytechinus pictus]|uniref:uncharacterized protein LOC135154888 n=1 Tax=Lytechinus pictus TaxID=7653 RepID=UPI0030BA1E92